MSNNPDLFSFEAPRRNRHLAWFVAGALLIVISAAAFMSVQKGMFKRTAHLYCLAGSAKGMSPGMAAKLNGFKVGALEKLAMDADGRVSMVLALSDEYRHLIHKDATARLTREDLIGDGIIDILPGSANSPTVENNALIAFERARDVSEDISKLADQLQPILADIKNITAYVDSPEGDLKKTLRELKRASAALADSGEGANDLIRNNKKQLQTAIASVSNTLDNLETALPPLLKRVDAGLQQLEGASSDVHTITSKLVTDIPPVVSEGRAALREGRTVLGEGLETLEDTHEMVNAVKGSWPVRNLLPPQEDRPLPLDSHVPISH